LAIAAALVAVVTKHRFNYAVGFIRRDVDRELEGNPVEELAAFRAWRRRQVIKWFLFTIVMSPFAILALLIALLIFFPDDSDSKDNNAKSDAHTLTQAAKAFQLKYARYPVKLDELVKPPDGSPFVEPDSILDPWQRPYQYDPAGPRNNGAQPDIWTVGHDGKLIGNWSNH